MVTYTSNTPIATDFPSTSQPQMLANFQYLIPSATIPGTGLQRDHAMALLSTSPSDGTHQQVTFNAALGAAPSLTGAVSALYPKTASSSAQMFYKNSLGDIQMTTITTNVPTLNATQGCSFLPGGLLIQWGSGSGALTFKVAFTTLYSVTATSNVATNFPWYISAQSTTGLTVTQVGGGSFAYNYIAIGLA